MEVSAWEGPLQDIRHAELRSNTCIRLVQIHAELFRGDISCTLQQYESDIQTCPDYAALSYVWGDSTPTQTVYINGLVYRVHQSLWEFLCHTRKKEGTRRAWLWTDLLCIDLGHHSEKNEQISRMGDIYAQAAYVTSWLGNHGEMVEALRVLVEISEEFDTRCAPKYAWNSSESEQIHKSCDQLGFREPYWGRVWILQEVACERNCIVAGGDTCVNFNDLLHKMEIAMKRSVRFDASADRDRKMKRIEALADLKTSIQQGKPIKILELIEKTSFCQERLGITCLVRSADAVQIDFYSDCCDPSTASVEPPHDAPWLSRSSSPASRFISVLETEERENREEREERLKRITAGVHEMRERRELRRTGRHKKRHAFELLSASESESDEEYWTAPSSPKEHPDL
ncbi:hypothetical protein INS49_014243 [Diaporthe citri]|uniref:uncharacterized protein n=1 Tax=Diaporthe citri TaxID=83186 RepID=UPI001C7F5A48|nr:uncharacterized protein INS49_014243 [Diaporthe citri]KAG6358359.1 hypothetical protein INS49_014243 [Diaporthe citri]